MDTFRLIIAGGRDFDDYCLLWWKCESILCKVQARIVIVTGHCVDKDNNPIGADYLGECYAREKGYDLEYYPAEWERFGKSAGPIRNRSMGQKEINGVVVFWDTVSRGSKNMIEVAGEFRLPLRIIKYIPKPKKFKR